MANKAFVAKNGLTVNTASIIMSELSGTLTPTTDGQILITDGTGQLGTRTEAQIKSDINAGQVETVEAGNGLTGGGTASSVTVTMGTPTTLTVSTTDTVGATTHAHAITTSSDVTGGTAAILASDGTGKLEVATLNAGTSLEIGGTAVSSNAGELNLVDGSSAGTVVNSKAVIYGSSGEVNATTLQIAGTSITSTAAELNILDGVTSTATEINIVDGGTSATSTTVADADRVVLNDNGTMVQVAVTDLKSYIHTNTSINDLSDATANASNFSNSVLIGQSSTGTLSNADFNVGLGYGVFNSLTSGTGNMGVGYNALNNLNSGGGNVALGRQVLSQLTTGSKNVGIGRQAAIQIVDGSVGGTSLTTGSQNTYIGAETVPSANNVGNETVIGYGATGSGSNTITLGNSSVTLVGVSADNTTDLGSSSKEFKDMYIDGTAYLDGVDIDGGSMDNTVIGGSTAAAGSFTTITASTSLDVSGSAGVILENDETITNSTDGTVEIGGNLSGTGSISGFDANLNDQTGTTYTLTSSDNGKVVTLNNANAITLTIAASLGDGFNCLIVQKGAGQVTLSAAAGVTVANRSSETKTAGQYATVSVINIGSDTYILSGDTGS